MDEKVLCPYCGAEMWFPKSAWEIVGIDMGGNNYTAYGKCRNCGAISPKGYGRTQDEAMEAARAAALRRYTPPLRPMTLEQVREAYMNSDTIGCAVVLDARRCRALFWAVIDRIDEDIVAVWNANNDCNYEERDYGKTWRCWKRKPTETEMREAAWEK